MGVGPMWVGVVIGGLGLFGRLVVPEVMSVGHI